MAKDVKLVQFVIPSLDDKATMFEMLQPLFEQLKSFLVEYGCENKDELLAKFDMAVDLVAAIDIPQIPNILEAAIDKFLSSYAKSAARKMAARFCA